MPIYTYICKDCGEKFDVLVGVTSKKNCLVSDSIKSKVEVSSEINTGAYDKEFYEHLKRFYDGWWGNLDM